jgi:hypothetical protein
MTAGGACRPVRGLSGPGTTRGPRLPECPRPASARDRCRYGPGAACGVAVRVGAAVGVFVSVAHGTTVGVSVAVPGGGCCNVVASMRESCARVVRAAGRKVPSA